MTCPRCNSLDTTLHGRWLSCKGCGHTQMVQEPEVLIVGVPMEEPAKPGVPEMADKTTERIALVLYAAGWPEGCVPPPTSWRDLTWDTGGKIVSVTEADKKRDEAIEHINSAIASLSAVVVERCPGWEDWKASYRASLRAWLGRLLQIRDEMEG